MLELPKVVQQASSSNVLYPWMSGSHKEPTCPMVQKIYRTCSLDSIRHNIRRTKTYVFLFVSKFASLTVVFGLFSNYFCEHSVSDYWPFNVYSYQSTLKQLFQEFNSSDPDDQLASVTTRIMQALQNNLDGKSKQYKDPALTQLFLMNNIHYIVRSVRRFVSCSVCII